jgi:RHS repeat-associated protein
MTAILNSESSFIHSNAVQLYEYSVYGQVAASDPNHTNPFLFTGRRFDTDTGLYYYRARYYNPYIGRFLQTDPIGYGDGMNMYAYCGNNSVSLADPSGTSPFSWCGFRRYEPLTGGDKLEFWWLDDNDEKQIHQFNDIEGWIDWAYGGGWMNDAWVSEAVGWEMANWAGFVDEEGNKDPKWWFWRLRAVMLLDGSGATFHYIWLFERDDFKVKLKRSYQNAFEDFDWDKREIRWNPKLSHIYDNSKDWHYTHPLALLAHELAHAIDFYIYQPGKPSRVQSEIRAVRTENFVRLSLFRFDPTEGNLYPRPGYTDEHPAWGVSAQEAWRSSGYHVTY